MSDLDEKKQEKEIEPQDDFVFIREKIKERPIDKRKLAINSMLTLLSAVMFGLIACVTFVFLAPVLTDKFASDDKETTSVTSIAPILFPEETEEEEMSPEDMLVSPEEPEIDFSELQLLEEQQIKELLSSITYTVSDYQKLYSSLAEIAQSATSSMVSITSMTQDTDWLSDLYEGTRESAGVIVAINDNNIYIIATYDDVKNANTILVKFTNGIRAIGEIGRYDKETGLCTIVVPYESINKATQDSITVAKLGSSFSTSLVGIPIIAVGSPMGTYGSVSYGILTGNSEKIAVIDNMYKNVTTDMYGSSSATGVIINLRGDVLGIISSKFTKEDSKNLICAIGITELKRTIENLINETELAYLGIVGSDVPEEAILTSGAPMGAYVMSVALGGPAMMAGVQSGDIITSYGKVTIVRLSELTSQLRITEPRTQVELTICRPVQGEYKEIKVTVSLGEKTEIEGKK